MIKEIVLTGFEPFEGSQVNPSILACQNLNGLMINDFKIVTYEIPLRYSE
ncbi:MAG: pyroglutamyl-peptidase I family protein, partial [Candidatus Heimdallarchaeaceae archaeon]